MISNNNLQNFYSYFAYIIFKWNLLESMIRYISMAYRPWLEKRKNIRTNHQYCFNRICSVCKQYWPKWNFSCFHIYSKIFTYNFNKTCMSYTVISGSRTLLGRLSNTNLSIENSSTLSFDRVFFKEVTM